MRSLGHGGRGAPLLARGLRRPHDRLLAIGRMVGVTALAVAVVLPGLVPHFPTTFLADGLGQSANGRGGTGSNVRLASSVDIARDLGSHSTDPVLRYTTTADDPQPLRVGILDSFRRGQWPPARTTRSSRRTDGSPARRPAPRSPARSSGSR